MLTPFPKMVDLPIGESNAMRFGKLTDEPIGDYHACGAISKSKIDVFRDSPRLFQMRFITGEIPPEKTEALLIGGAVDCLALEGPEAFAKRFVTEPEGAPKYPSKAQFNAKKPSPETLNAIAFWTAFDEANKGKETLNAKQWALVKRCADALHANATFAKLFAGAECQVTFRIRGDRFAMQCRPDLWLEQGCELTDGKPCIPDVKTIAELPADNPEHLMRHIGDYGYHRAAYIYPEIVAAVMKARAKTEAEREFWETFRPQFLLVFVEKREPHAVIVRTVDEIARDVGEREVGDALAKLRRCLAEKHWPESWDEPLAPLGLSSWYVRRALENTESNLFG